MTPPPPAGGEVLLAFGIHRGLYQGEKAAAVGCGELLGSLHRDQN
jgi:hypothetical protein